MQDVNTALHFRIEVDSGNMSLKEWKIIYFFVHVVYCRDKSRGEFNFRSFDYDWSSVSEM